MSMYEMVQGKMVFGEELAVLRTTAAKAEIESLRSLLVTAIASGTWLDWEGLEKTVPFPEPPPPVAASRELPPEPKSTDLRFRYSWWKRLLTPRNQRERRFADAQAAWRNAKAEIDATRAEDQAQLAAWENRKRAFLDPQERLNQTIIDMRRAFESAEERYLQGEVVGIPNFLAGALYHASLAATINGKKALQAQYQVSLLSETRILIIDRDLPTISDLPNVKQVRYVRSRTALDEIKLRPTELYQLYDDLIYQICLTTLHRVFLFDSLKTLKTAVFNGWVTFPDPATGNDRRSCIISVQAERETFTAINLERVDPKVCFRALKGVGSAKLHGMVPVAPLIQGSQDDPRFIESVEVADRIREGTNLAAIGWEDFEQLIREIFEKEFKSTGGEVRVTRASRDWGVDAIAFDPDPIRGEKIVIQAKRYTNTVEVSAVRGLYGTVMNEGATKGILVTTSSFGPEAYAFAKDKPLTLMDGSNLWHLLERHGHRAHIDLAEAKRLNPTPLARSLGH